MQARYVVEFEVTSRHKKRQKNDMQTEFSYIHWLMEAPKSNKVKVDKNLYKAWYRVNRDCYIFYNSFISKSSNFNQPQFQSVQDGGQIGYVSYWNSASKVSFEKLSIFFLFVTFISLKNKAALQKIRVQLRSRLKYLCINDLMEHEKPEAVQAKLVLDSFYKELYPKKSSFEL